MLIAKPAIQVVSEGNKTEAGSGISLKVRNAAITVKIETSLRGCLCW